MSYFEPVLFPLLKLYARLAIKFYCRKIVVNKPEILKLQGPVLFAANHPNSFLDGMILTTLLENDLYSLARGDVFKRKKIGEFLFKIHLLPVYRTSEGVENLSHNYTTFAACHQVFRNRNAAIIFSEGRCINEWHLRPLRKGTARLAISTWLNNTDVTVIPLGFNYNTFRNYGKNVFLHFGTPLDKDRILQQPSEGKQLLEFNRQLKEQLKQLVYEIDPKNKVQQRKQLTVSMAYWKKGLLAPFAALGWLLHIPFYYPVKAFIKNKFDNDHFDSVMAGLTVLLYPFYLILWLAIAFFFGGIEIAFLALLLLPFSAWACVQLKPQLDP